MPLVTHFNQTTNQIEFGATGIKTFSDPLFSSNMNKYLNRETDFVPYFNQTILPDHYLADEYDSETYSNEAVRATLNDFCVQSGAPVRMIQVRQKITTAAQLASLINYGKNYWQILHSISYKHNLFSIVLPPNFKIKENLPFLINGAYGLNLNFITWEGPFSRGILAKSYKQGVRAVSILWNGMGAIGSRTMNNQAYSELNDFMKLAIPLIGLDPSKGISFGTSRGGVTAINLASHPKIDAFRAAYVDASVPASDPALIVTMISPTVPHLLNANDWSVGYVGSWMKSFRYPLNSLEPRLSGLSGTQAHYSILTGSFNMYESDNFRLQSNQRLAKLNQNNTSVFLEIGSHDFIVPFADQIGLAYNYFTNLNNIEISVNYLAGHFGLLDSKQNRLLNALKILSSKFDSTALIKNKNVQRNIVGSTSRRLDSISTVDYTPLPLTIELPRYIIEESPTQIILTGTAHRRIRLEFQGNEGDLKEFTTEIGENGYVVLESQISNWPNSIYHLSNVFELDQQNQKFRRIQLRLTVTRKEDLTMYKYSGDLRPYAQTATSVILNSINGGPNGEESAFEENSTNYGGVEVGYENVEGKK